MDKIGKKVLTMISTFAMAMSFLCYGTDANARNEVTMLVCGDSEIESNKAFNTLYRHLLGGRGVCTTSDYYTRLKGSLNLDDVSAELSASVAMYRVKDLNTIPELRFPSDLLVLVYAGKEAKGVGNLPLLQEELKRRKHRIELPEMVLLRLDEVLPSSYDDENPGLKLVKACGQLWTRGLVKEKGNGTNADDYNDSFKDWLSRVKY
jgi:hypothetical protein